jgi:hypothetical protein
MSEPMTCGRGMTARASLPAQAAELMRALAEVLAVHQTSLERTDESAARELEAYSRVEGSVRAAAAQLESAADLFRACRELPAAPHDVSVLGGANAVGAFRSFVDVEERTLELLRATLEQDRNVLQMMQARK